MAAAAASPGASVTIPGLGRDSLQGDVGFGEVLEKMGASVTLDDASGHRRQAPSSCAASTSTWPACPTPR